MSDHKMSIQDAVLEPQADLGGLQRRALLVGVVAAAVSAFGYTVAPAVFDRAYLVGCLLWLGVAAGLLGLGMLNHVAGGRWGMMARRVFEASGRTLPVFLLFLLPVMLRLDSLYPWADPEIATNDPLVAAKTSWWLFPSFFYVRQVVYLLGLGFIGWQLSRLSHRHDETGDPALRIRMQKLSAGGLVFFVLTGTFASVDWVMSLDPHWFSSLFGFSWVIGQGLSAWAFLVPMMIFLGARSPHKPLVTPRLFHDYGKLMLAFVMLWTYMMIGQYLIIWSGNLPEEVTWYLARNTHGWSAVSVSLVIFHFALPFLFLLSAELKKRPKLLRLVAFWMLGARFLDLYWLVTPSAMHWHEQQGRIPHHSGFSFHWLDVVPAIAIGGFWIALLVGQLKKRAVLPVEDPLLKEAIAHG